MEYEMNERIRELEKQATETVECGLNGTHTALRFNRKKFAELIIRECMTQIQQVREIKAGHAGPEYTQGFDDGMFVAISTIEEHFGVKE
jgi:hypothetical protein